MDCQITWYGRCCFLVEIESKKILFDPYDRYCNVDIGIIDADILISSSTWHDHGHIGASPLAWVFSYPGTYEHEGFLITGIEAKENRGTPTVVFNLQYADFSITNFADLGVDVDAGFNKHLTADQRTVLKNTNIAFIRANVENQNGLRYCNPSIIIPEHYFPVSFISEQVPSEEKEKFLEPNRVVDQMEKELQFPIETVQNCRIRIFPSQLKEKTTILKFQQLHPQVRHITP